ncbi:hypothetical protein [Mesorhizobium sp. RIZ17]|uniref:hypothetical protein n=1 Tax=Mesorhizobium sp. RIZ17 TaxID=3132743 RepID=UPI003DA95098
MQDHELVERPGKGWSPWKEGAGLANIEAVWWDARVLHFAKLNCSCAFSGSELVGIEHWGYGGDKWTMKKPPVEHPPLPEEFRLERERVREERLARAKAEAKARFLAACQRRQQAKGVSAGCRTAQRGDARLRLSRRNRSISQHLSRTSLA